ncbi:MAG: HAD family phosphatase [Betaproteobacteria bacterium]|nr:HAD family phosphatase [Betaproteobacteria bacterium]
MLKAILWDNDGVLVDTEHLYFLATRDTLAARGIEISEGQYLDLFLRQSRGILHFAREHGWPGEELEAVRRERGALYSELLRGRSHVIDGVGAVLAALHGRYRMGIVTSSQREHFDIIHETSGLLRYFEFVIASGDYANPKPHPEPYLKGIERAGVARDECLVIEDSERGLAAATAAGVRCIIVPSRLTAGCAFSDAHRVLSSIRDLPGVL